MTEKTQQNQLKWQWMFIEVKHELTSMKLLTEVRQPVIVFGRI
jgi:hypothetical protein